MRRRKAARSFWGRGLDGIRRAYGIGRQRFAGYRKKNWEGTGTLLFWASVFLSSLCAGMMAGEFMRPAWAGKLLVSLAAAPLAALFLWGIGKAVRLFLQSGMVEFFSFLLLCAPAFWMMSESPSMGKGESLCLAAAFGAAAAFFLKSLWAVLYHKRRGGTVLACLACTAVLLLAAALFLASDGFSDTYVETYLSLAEDAREGEEAGSAGDSGQNKTTESGGGAGSETTGSSEKVGSETAGQSETTGSGEEAGNSMEAAFREYAAGGPYTALSITYGPKGKELTSGTADISRFAQNKGIYGILKEAYQGYPLTSVPMSGIVWYPKEADGCPTLFLAHGNHTWLEDSYLGYAYLGEYLASCGYVVVSVDENACNALAGENDGRAVLLLENMKQMESFNSQEGSPLYKKMDFSSLALAGHSRGGETAALAYLFNSLSYYPDNGAYRFGYHFSIQSLIAIAPTCGQYHPSGRSVELSDVNYFVLQGANDQDVRTFQGMEQYEDVHFTGKEKRMKAALYVAGLNHGQFNSRWGKYDLAEPMSRMLNVRNFLPQEEQQQIAKVFVRAFLDETMGTREAAFSDLLTDCGKYGTCLPRTLYVQSYARSGQETICDFEEDTRLETATMEGAYVEASHVKVWKEEKLTFSNGKPRGNYVAVLKWGSGGADDGRELAKEGAQEKQEDGECAQIRFLLPGLDASGKSLRFDLMDLRGDFTEEEARLLSAEAVVRDANGHEAAVRVGDYARIYPPFLVRLNKWQYLSGDVEYKRQFQTVSIPLADFEGVDAGKITQVTLRFLDPEGEAAVDNVAVGE